MKKRVLHALLTAALVLPGMLNTQVAMAQDPEFSQFYAQPLYLNPALAGTGQCNRFALNYRNQYPSVKAYEQYAFSYDQNVDFLRGGVGVLLFRDRQGPAYSDMKASLMYSYQLNMSDNFTLRPAIKATYVMATLDPTKLTFDVDNNGNRVPTSDPAETGGVQDKNYLDFSAGIVGFTENFYFGAAADHLTEPDEGFTRESLLPMKITAHAGSVIPQAGGTSISPNLLFQNQGSFRQLNAGLYYSFNPVVIGAWYRHAFTNSDAVIALLGLQKDQYRIGYSYDLTVSELRSGISGAHEFSFAYEFCTTKKRKAIQWRPLDCPRF